MKQTKRIAIALMTGILLTGCAGRSAAGPSDPKESCVYVDKDGKLSAIIVEPYNAEDEDPEGLKSFAEQAVIAYNKEKGGEALSENSGDSESRLPAALRDSRMEKGKAVLTFDYATVEDLFDFSGQQQQDLGITGIETGTVSDGVAEGKIVDGSFISAKDGSEVSGQEVTKKDSNKLVTVYGGGTIQTQGKIIYMTKGVSAVDEHTVRTPEGKSYIIFK